MTGPDATGTEPLWLVRVVEWFEKEPGNALLGEAGLQGASLEELQRLWRMPANDPMLESFPVSEGQRARVEQWAGIHIDLERADYFITAYTNDFTASQADGGYLSQFPPPLFLPAFPDAKVSKPRE